MKSKSGILAALVLGAMLAGCAATGTKVSTTNDLYKDMANSQKWWCNSSTFGGSCGCTIDGMKTTCSLAQSCVSSGNCKVAQ
jgi:hypothetical protein